MRLKLVSRRDFPDHHPYSEQDHQDLLGLLEDSDLVVTTEKDAVKVRRYPWPEGKILFLRLDLALENEPAFWARLEEWVPRTKRDGMRGEQGI
jgi:tetraacyldisaccharide-1-P 4'-kinase